MKKKVGIIGFGIVGSAMARLFPEAVGYDKFNNLYLSWKSAITQEMEQRATTIEKDINLCDVAFICVPTPYVEGKGLDMTAVEESVAACECPLIIIRSTLQPGTVDRLTKKYKKEIVMMPEYLGETVSHPLNDESARNFMVLGGSKKGIRMAIELFQEVYNANISIRQVSALEAEIIKISENRAIAFKVAQCQELYDACEAAGIDYYTIRDAVYGDDPRFTLWWSFIFPDNRGFNSKCIPKDIYAWEVWAKESGIEPELTSALLKYNAKLIGGGDEDKDKGGADKRTTEKK